MSGATSDPAYPLRESLALSALDALPDASVLVFSTGLRYEIVRGSALARYGFSAAEFEGRPVADALGDERWAFYEPLYRAALGGDTRSTEIRSLDGERWYQVEVGPLRSGDGEIIGGVSIAVDITDRKELERLTLAKGEQRFQAAVDTITDGL